MSEPKRDPSPPADHSVEILRTLTGMALTVRPLEPRDERVLESLFDNITPSDLRFRFFSTMKHIDRNRLDAMIHPEGAGSASFIAFDASGTPVATSLFVADTNGREGEIAVAVRSNVKRHGIGWLLLAYSLAHAKRSGFQKVRSVESRDNAATLNLEHEVGFSMHAHPEDPTLTIATIDLLKWEG